MNSVMQMGFSWIFFYRVSQRVLLLSEAEYTAMTTAIVEQLFPLRSVSCCLLSLDRYAYVRIRVSQKNTETNRIIYDTTPLSKGEPGCLGWSGAVGSLGCGNRSRSLFLANRTFITVICLIAYAVSPSLLPPPYACP